MGTAIVVGPQRAAAEITPNVVVVDVGPLQETGDEYVTYRLVVVVSNGDDWTSAVVNATVTDATFYQNGDDDGNPPDPMLFDDFPDSEVTSYYTSPADFPNAAHSGTAVGFNAGPTETPTSLSADWYDTVNTGDGVDLVLAQFTVLPDSSVWSGTVDVTVYSVNNPGGVAGSFAISSADYNPPVTTTYVGPDGGSYNDPANWDIGLVPVNGAPNPLDRYNVIIPGGVDVGFDAPGTSRINGLQLGTDSTLAFNASEALQVLGSSILAGIIDAAGSGAAFLAPSQFTVFHDGSGEAHVTNAATVDIGAPSYTFDRGNYEPDTGLILLSAEDPDTLLDLSSLTSITVPYDRKWTSPYSIMATNGGAIDMQNVDTITGVGPGCWYTCDSLRFEIATGGNINLQSLQAVTGRTTFDIDVPGYTLGSLEIASTTHLDASDAVTVNLPELVTFSDGTLSIGGITTVNADALGYFVWSTMSIADGGVVNAHALTNVEGSVFDLKQNQVLNAPPFTKIDHARIELSDSAVLEPAASTYTFDRGNYEPDTGLILLSAEDPDTLLDLSSLTSITVPYDRQWTSPYSIMATNGGTIDLRNVDTITGVGPDCWYECDWLSFAITGGGDINLESLTVLDGRVRFELDADYALNSLLAAADGAVFELGPWATLSVPLLSSVLGSYNEVTVPVFATFDAPLLNVMSGTSVAIEAFGLFEAPALTEMQDSALSVEALGAVNAPNLTTFTSSAMTLMGIQQGEPDFIVPSFTDIDHSRFILKNRSAIAVAAPSYTFDRGNYEPDTGLILLSAEDPDTLLDLSSLTSITVPYDRQWTSPYSIMATNGGTIDLRNVDTITGVGPDCWYECDWLRFSTNVDNGLGGQFLFGDLIVTGARTMFEIESPSSLLDFSGSFTLRTPSKLSVRVSAEVRIGGDFSFDHTDEVDFDTGGGIFHMNGAGTQQLEVAGEDIGIPDGPVSNNFEIGQLIVGEVGQLSVVKLVDDLDNGNRGTGAVESLYLQGFPGSDNGLRILGGSVLLIENIQVYAQEADEWVHINTHEDWVPGDNCFAYDQGFVCLSGPGPDCNNNTIEDRVDILIGNSLDCNGNDEPDECEIEVGCPGPGGPFFCFENCGSDCNVNCVPDECDINAGTSQECNKNGVPDECEIDQAAGPGNYCDPDDPPPPLTVCDPDVDGNGIPDECDDCNGNGVQDWEDLANCDDSPWCRDCNLNGVLDQCDINDGTSIDLNGNGIPDECEPDCNDNNILDSQDIIDGTSRDCNGNAVPDECEIDQAAGPGYFCDSAAPPPPLTSCDADVNGNGIPDICEPDCNDNGIPDTWDIAVGTSLDCQLNSVPDECDVDPADPDEDGEVSNDVDGDTVPDECEPDCQPNGVPDDWDILMGSGVDCQGNGIPDECDIASGSSLDTDGNGIPDECEDCNGNGIQDYIDVANGTSEDCNGNLLPDECEPSLDSFQWIGSDGGSFTDPTNWDLGSVPGGDAVLSNTSAVTNKSILANAGMTEVCSLTVEATEAGEQILQINSGSTLYPASGAVVNTDGEIELAGGTLLGPTINNAGASIVGFGAIEAEIVNTGILEGSIAGTLTLDGPALGNQPSGTIIAPFGSLIDVRSTTVMQQGAIEVHSSAVAHFAHALTNQPNASISILGGALGADGLINQAMASITGFGTIEADLANDVDGDVTVVADTEIVGNVENNGTITVQSGLLTIIGNLTGSGTIIGDFGGGGPMPLGNNGLTVLGDSTIDAASSLTLIDGVLKVGGNFDVAINDSSRFGMTGCTLQFVGVGGTWQTMETLAEDVGRDVDLPDASLFSLNRLRIGPTATTVRLVDNRDNATGAGSEALYISTLVLESGISIDLAGLRIYYGTVTPAAPFNPGSGVTVTDSVGGGGLVPIGLSILGDFDDDGDVDVSDYTAWSGCVTGPGNDPYPEGCEAFDFDSDLDVDLHDFAGFQAAFTGSP